MNQLKDELVTLKSKLSSFEDKVSPKNLKKKESPILTIAIELVAGIVSSVLVGIWLDNFFQSRPIAIILCLVFGIVATCRTVWSKIKKAL